MTLTLTIISAQQAQLGPDGVKVFNACGGSIGRAAGNDWVLPDPERFISSRHCAIRYADGAYYIDDTSTNGLFVNEAAEPLGNGNSLMLHSGDQIALGDYLISVAIEDRQAAPAPAAFDDFADPFADAPLTDRNAVTTSPTAPGFVDQAGQEVTDPLALFGQTGPSTGVTGSATLPEDDFLNPRDAFPAAEADNLPADQQFFQPPAAHSDAPGNNMIPDDWDLTTGFNIPAPASVTPQSPSPPVPPLAPPAPPAAAPPGTPEVGNTPPPAAAPMPPPSAPVPPAHAVQPMTPPGHAPVSPAPVGAQDAGLLQAFLSGAGIDDVRLPDAQAQQMMHTLGQVLRVAIQGMMEVLMARSSLKSEFRMAMTVIRPVENNPLKFSMGVDDALRSLLTKQGGGYLPPLQAVQEGVDDIKGHQMAMMAGMQAAFAALMQRLDPKAVEGEADKGSGIGSLLPAARKARCWDSYQDLYKALSREVEDNFQAAFGEEFARAYEAQIKKLRQARSAP